MRKRIVCYVSLVGLALAYVGSVISKRWKSMECSASAITRLQMGAALVAVLALVLECDGAKIFNRAPVDEQYHDDNYHYQLFLTISLLAWLATMRPCPRADFLNQHQTEGPYQKLASSSAPI